MGFFDKAKSLGSKTLEEGKKYAEITKHNVSISSCEGQIKDCKLKIGNIVAERFADQFAGEPDIMEQLIKLNELNQKIEELRAKISEIKNASAETNEDSEVVVEQMLCESSADETEITEIIQPESQE